MKTLEDIWDEYCEHNALSAASRKDLIFHLENDIDPVEAITLATDMGLTELGPYIAKHLEHEEDYIRELSVGCLLGQLRLEQFAEQGLRLALHDPDSTVRNLAIFNLGAVLNNVQDRNLKDKIAQFLYHTVIDPNQAKLMVGAAYQSILDALDVPQNEQPSVIDLSNEINSNLVEKFRDKFGISS